MNSADPKPPCMACAVRDNPNGLAPPDFVYVVALVDATRSEVPAEAIVANLCTVHKADFDEIVANYDRFRRLAAMPEAGESS